MITSATGCDWREVRFVNDPAGDPTDLVVVDDMVVAVGTSFADPPAAAPWFSFAEISD